MLDRIGYGDVGIALRRPIVKTYSTANPAANNEFTITVPAGAVWKLTSVTVQLVETVQTPWPALTISDSAAVKIFQAQAGTAAMAATNTSQVTWSVGAPTLGGAADTVRSGTLPNDLYLGPGFVIASVTAGIGANCDYGVASLLVVEYG